MVNNLALLATFIINWLGFWLLFRYNHILLLFVSFILFLLGLMVVLFIFRGARVIQVLSAIFYILILFFMANVTTFHEHHQTKLHSFFVPDPKLGWRALPNIKNLSIFEAAINRSYVASTNSHGFRGPWPPRDTQANVVQGDSNVFGYGLAETETIPEQLRQQTGDFFLNLGVNGFDVHQYILQSRQIKATKTLPIKNRLLIFSLGNDYACSALITPYFYPRPYFVFDDHGKSKVIFPPVPITRQQYGLHFIPPLDRYDYVLAPLVREGGNLLDNPVIPAPSLRLPVVKWGLEMLLDNSWGRFLLRMTRKKTAPSDPGQEALLDPCYGYWAFLKRAYWPAPYRQFLPDFAKLMTLITDQGDHPLLVLLPWKSQVNPPDQETALRTLHGLGYSNSQIDFEALNQEITNLAQRLGLPCLDLTSTFKNFPHPQELFQADNHHVSVQGVKLMTAAIANYLKNTDKPNKFSHN